MKANTHFSNYVYNLHLRSSLYSKIYLTVGYCLNYFYVFLINTIEWLSIDHLPRLL